MNEQSLLVHDLKNEDKVVGMEFEDQDQKEEASLPAPAGYETPVNSSIMRAARPKMSVGHDIPERKPVIRYKECQKNHAVGIGGHAVDGCGEFMAAGAEGTLDSLKCAACNCHRNFHRKETGCDITVIGRGGGGHFNRQSHFPRYYTTPPPPAGYLRRPHCSTLPLIASRGPGTNGRDDREHVLGGTASGDGTGGTAGKKRFQTKFTPQQKEKMEAFAEGVGWRIDTHHDVAVQQFCMETGVKSHVLKVWLHSNKHTLGKKP